MLFRSGKVHQEKFSRGDVVQPLTVIGDTDKVGTYVHFKPDAEIFEEIVFDYKVLEQRLKETAFLTKALRILNLLMQSMMLWLLKQKKTVLRNQKEN